ncbi:hypothetical protein P7H17_16620 [Paenibacillus larvae]|nr:hypothetical protein [Paenibacillus larvae]MDT2287332.1 hypothetical protein [Paenibacillus larvae]
MSGAALSVHNQSGNDAEHGDEQSRRLHRNVYAKLPHLISLPKSYGPGLFGIAAASGIYSGASFLPTRLTIKYPEEWFPLKANPDMSAHPLTSVFLTLNSV